MADYEASNVFHVTFKGVAEEWIPVANPVHFVPKSTPSTLVDGGDDAGLSVEGTRERVSFCRADMIPH